MQVLIIGRHFAARTRPVLPTANLHLHPGTQPKAQTYSGKRRFRDSHIRVRWFGAIEFLLPLRSAAKEATISGMVCLVTSILIKTPRRTPGTYMRWTRRQG